MTLNKLLWTVQGLLALLFLFAGVTKLVLPPEAMAGPVHFPVAFLRFIGVAEIMGAIGLVVPGLARIRPALTPVAAFGLVIIMLGATVVTAVGGAIAPAMFPLVVGALAGLVAYGRAKTWALATSI